MYHFLNAMREILKNIIMQTPVMTVKEACKYLPYGKIAVRQV